MHYFSTDFLEAMAEKLKQQGQYHIAHKKIPSKDGPVQVTDALSNRTHAVLVPTQSVAPLAASNMNNSIVCSVACRQMKEQESAAETEQHKACAGDGAATIDTSTCLFMDVDHAVSYMCCLLVDTVRPFTAKDTITVTAHIRPSRKARIA